MALRQLQLHCSVCNEIRLHTQETPNHTLHIVAIAQAAGLIVNWDDFSDLSDVVPLLARIYPNGGADVNHFHAAGGMGFLIRELLGAGLLHEDVLTVSGKGLAAYAQEPFFSPLPTGSHGVMRRPSAATHRCFAPRAIRSAPMAG